MRNLEHPWDLVVLGIEIALFIYFLFANAFYVFTAIVALRRLPWFVKLHRVEPMRSPHSALEQPVSMIVPAYNEERGIVDTVESLLAIDYAASEIIVVNDGSTDRTLEVLTQKYSLEPYPSAYDATLPTNEVKHTYLSTVNPALRVIDKVRGGKADALNAGLNASRFPLVLACDSDSYYAPSALQWMTEPFQRDPYTVVVGGAIGIGNDCFQDAKGGFRPTFPKHWLPRFQALEYLRAFVTTRLGFASHNALGIVSGACGLWRKSVLVEAGGYRTDTVWEDMEMTLRVHHMLSEQGRKYHVNYTPYPVCWTFVPNTVGELFHQRKLWHRHLSECMAIHRRLLWTRGPLGWVTMPYLAFVEWLAPLAVSFGLIFAGVGIYFHFLDWYSQVVLLGLVLMLALVISIVTILLDEISFTMYRPSSIWGLFMAAILENFGYRQFVGLASFTGFFAWAFRTKYHGRKPPGPFVKAWNPEPASKTPI